MDPVAQTHLSSLLIFFFLLLSTALVGTGGNSSSNIGHTLTRERKIQAISTKSEICCDIYVLPSYRQQLYQQHSPHVLWVLTRNTDQIIMKLPTVILHYDHIFLYEQGQWIRGANQELFCLNQD